MILPMSRVRIIGPRDRLPVTLDALQDFGRLQLDRIPVNHGLSAAATDKRAERERRALQRLLTDADAAIDALRIAPGTAAVRPTTRSDIARWARWTRRQRRRGEAIRSARQTLVDERTLLGKYENFLEAFRVLLAELVDAHHLRVYGVTIPGHERARVDALADGLRAELNVEVIVSSRILPSGDVAVLIAVPADARARMERAFGNAKIAEVPLPSGYTGESLTEAAPRLLARLAEIPRLIQATDAERAAVASTAANDLRAIRVTADDRLASLAATSLSAATRHAFAIEGWLPRAYVGALRSVLERNNGAALVVEELAREDWQGSDAPVVLANPRLFRPFEAISKVMPLPAYGSIDPTPFLAVGFPMLFGMILGDIGYGAVLTAAALVAIWRSEPTSKWRTVAGIALPCAIFAVVFGVLYGELFGQLGRRWLGLRPVLFDREHSVIAAILVAVGVGVAHTALGLVLGMVAKRHERRAAMSRAVQLFMLVVIVLALLSAVHVLPDALFGPLALAAVIGFPLLVLLEGIVAPIEFFSTLSSVLSYVRIMALGTASVLLASVANDFAGMFGSAVVGVLFALLFHLVNFAMGLFSPTIHALRLHYVEFFKHFYSPGGRPYEPFRHRAPHSPEPTRGQP
jgi:V/A-type H+-transporting ATPase subunit I